MTGDVYVLNVKDMSFLFLVSPESVDITYVPWSGTPKTTHNVTIDQLRVMLGVREARNPRTVRSH